MKKYKKILLITLLIIITNLFVHANGIEKFVDVQDEGTVLHYESIYKIANRGIITGYNNGFFEPNKPLSILEYAVILTRTLELERSNFISNSKITPDLPTTHWAYDYVMAAIEHGYISPFSNLLSLHKTVTKNNVEELVSDLGLELVLHVSDEITRGEMSYIVNQILTHKENKKLDMPTLIETSNEKLQFKANASYLYSLLGEYLVDDTPVTNESIALILLDRMKISYPNYDYYNHMIKDTSKGHLIKAFSEGLLEIDPQGYVQPYKELTRDDVYRIVKRLEEPLTVARPQYVERRNIPILMYHEINTLPKNGPTGLYVSKENFSLQLDALQKNGYNTVTMEQVYQHWKNQVPLPENPVVLTFDDAYISHRNFATVELSKRGMVGTFYVIMGEFYLNDPWYVNEQDIKEMYELGMEIGSHTLNHIDSRNTRNAVLLEEYKESKERLETLLGTDIHHFCYPYGASTQYALQTLNELGYRTAVKTTYGKANKNQGYYRLSRIRIFYTDTINAFLNRL
ncbi:peptidoglycan/xylan/chitin deacetylase (PgdA/CDA1 family) [Natranaerovirga pectinivora]|uniref:Peptidoglycan/xylan/chitin deacetylase (PgdA/CDA1 family) n=1 Tax=Natranaerovirga pectinivora TaxID=682400 RepID=A0A4R3MS21_9FIRM|nr:polysaccharide deacetylase family protein [Natranaerovirga pectinivora]TCT16218.1 peptidoglycan/xylan/chitin deacetylase (PgdA/CDA1 family) [Natranaerovirga pectinivora]